MGKCVKCHKREAGWYNDRGKRSFCVECKNSESLPRKKIPKAANVAIASTVPVPLVTPPVGTKVDVESLPAIPIILNISVDVWTMRAADIVALRPGRGNESILDVSTNRPQQALAIKMGAAIIDDYDTMDAVCERVAGLMGINSSACFGVNIAGHVTPRHQHAPMGVMHIASGNKLWRFWRPASKEDNPEMILKVLAGQLLWLPPGWSHEVITLQGDVFDESNRVYNVCWSGWCLPRNQSLDALIDMFDGTTTEEQLGGRTLTMKAKKEISQVVKLHAANGRKVDVESRH